MILAGIDSRESLGAPDTSVTDPNDPTRTAHRKTLNTMIDPYDRNSVVTLLRQAADHIAQGVTSPQIHSNLHHLADHLEQED